MAVHLTGIELSGPALESSRKAPKAQQGGASGSSQHASQQAGIASQQADSLSQQADVTITSTASVLASVQQTLTGRGSFDDSRVESIRQALEAGTYTVEPRKIADNLLHSERGLAPLPLREL